MRYPAYFAAFRAAHVRGRFCTNVYSSLVRQNEVRHCFFAVVERTTHSNQAGLCPAAIDECTSHAVCSGLFSAVSMHVILFLRLFNKQSLVTACTVLCHNGMISLCACAEDWSVQHRCLNNILVADGHRRYCDVPVIVLVTCTAAWATCEDSNAQLQCRMSASPEELAAAAQLEVAPSAATAMPLLARKPPSTTSTQQIRPYGKTAFTAALSTVSCMCTGSIHGYRGSCTGYYGRRAASSGVGLRGRNARSRMLLLQEGRHLTHGTWREEPPLQGQAQASHARPCA